MSYSFDLGINSYKSIEKIYTEKSLMPYSFDLGIDTINNNSYKSTEKINDSFDLGINAINNNSYKSTEKIPYSFDLGINTVNNNSYKSTEKIPYSFDLMGVGNNSTITTPSISVNNKKQKWQKKKMPSISVNNKKQKWQKKKMPNISVNKKNQKWQKKKMPNLKEISSSLGGPIHNLITAITIFKNNPQMNVAELARKCNTLTISKLMNETNSNNYKEEITKRFLEDGYDDIEESLKPWILDL
ncbi:442_t:CDS:2 [Entrophospora sp. SA101]|nr:442_t:CDS:2 [Entrophospora sp. SA101]